VRIGHRLADARAVLPQLVVRAADPEADAAALARLADWCARWTPWAAPDGDDGIALDVSGVTHLFGGEAALAGEIVRRLARLGLEARAAVAEGAAAAWALARFGGARTVVLAADETRPALEPLPVAALRLDAETVAGLRRVGLRRIGELARIPRGPLAARFGAAVADRLDLVFGRADAPLSPRRPAPRFLARIAFPEPIGHADDVAKAAHRLSDDLCRLLERDGQGARALELRLYLADGRVLAFEAGLARASRRPEHLVRLLAERLKGLDPGFGADVLSLAALVAEPLGADQLALELPAAQRGEGEGAPFADPELGLLVDRLGVRLGVGNVARQAPRASWLPERAVRPVAPLAPPAGDGFGETPPRPVELLACPEPVEAVAEVPDGPPAQFRWRGRWRRVARADGPERLAPEWWRDLASAGEATRDYYRIEDEEGRRFWLYRLGLYGAATAPRWYLHGFFG